MCNATYQKIDAKSTVTPERFVATEDEEVLRQRTIAEWNRPSQFYANRFAIQSPAI